MTTELTVTLSPENRSFLEAQAAEGFASPGAYLDAMVRQARLRRVKLALDEKIRQTLKEPAIEVTQADWDEIRREIIEGDPELRGGA